MWQQEVAITPAKCGTFVRGGVYTQSLPIRTSCPQSSSNVSIQVKILSHLGNIHSKIKCLYLLTPIVSNLSPQNEKTL